MTDFDFIPTHYHAAARGRRRRRSNIGWSVALVVAMVAWVWSHEVRIARAAEQRDLAQAEWRDHQERKQFVEQLQRERDRLRAYDVALRSLDDAAAMSVTLAELGIHRVRRSIEVEE